MKKAITKIITLIVTITMLLSLACPVFAGEVELQESSWTVTYDANQEAGGYLKTWNETGEQVNESSLSLTYNEGDTFQYLKAQGGYSFFNEDPMKYLTGWKDAEGNAYNAGDPVTEDLTVYAQWETLDFQIIGIEDVTLYTGINTNNPGADYIHYSVNGVEQKRRTVYLQDSLYAEYGIELAALEFSYKNDIINPSAGIYPATCTFAGQSVDYNVVVEDPPTLSEGQIASFKTDKTALYNTTHQYYSFIPDKTGTYVFTANEININARMATIRLYQDNQLIANDYEENPGQKTDTCTQFTYKLKAGQTYRINVSFYSIIDRDFTFAVTNANIKNMTTTLAKSSYKYTGKKITPAVTVKDGKVTLKKDVDYTVSYKTNKDGGTATVTIKGKGMYTGTVSKTFKITNAPQTIKAAAKTVKAAKVKKKAQTVTGAITGYQGTTTFTKVAKGSSKNLSINKKTGKITVKKGTPKGTYTIKVKVVAKGNTYFKKTTKTVTVKVKVK